MMKFSGLVVNGDGTANFQFSLGDGRFHNEPAKPCTDCGGDGMSIGEEPVIDYVHGGYLKEVEISCETCEGYGWVVKDDGQEEE